jgi:hypothetical protein
VKEVASVTVKATGMPAAVEVTTTVSAATSAPVSRRGGRRKQEGDNKYTGEEKMKPHTIYSSV